VNAATDGIGGTGDSQIEILPAASVIFMKLL
jgi:hypothetical protein